MTNTTQNVGQTHEHNFSSKGVCGCGLTHDQWRAQHEAELAAKQPKESNAPNNVTPVSTEGDSGTVNE